MISSYGSQKDYDAMAGKDTGEPAWSAEDFAALGQFMAAWNKELEESGELVATYGLLEPVLTRRVASPSGAAVVTDGPYAETQEVLAGFWIVGCDSFDRATEIAARLNDAPVSEHIRARAYADVRPIAESRHDLEA